MYVTSKRFLPSHCYEKKLKLLFSSLNSYRFTQIVVDSQIKTPGGKTYDVIFVGTGEYISFYNSVDLLYFRFWKWIDYLWDFMVVPKFVLIKSSRAPKKQWWDAVKRREDSN